MWKSLCLTKSELVATGCKHLNSPILDFNGKMIYLTYCYSSVNQQSNNPVFNLISRPLSSSFSLCRSYKWEANDRVNKVSYTLRLCESSPPTSCDPGTAVCAEDRVSGNTRSVGECSREETAVRGSCFCSCMTVFYQPGVVASSLWVKHSRKRTVVGKVWARVWQFLLRCCKSLFSGDCDQRAVFS